MSIPILEVEWEDACSSTAWRDVDEAKEWASEPLICVTVGYLISNTKGGIALSMSKTQNSLGGLWFIPRGVIRRVKRVRK